MTLPFSRYLVLASLQKTPVSRDASLTQNIRLNLWYETFPQNEGFKVAFLCIFVAILQAQL
jgi:hypothetical protein